MSSLEPGDRRRLLAAGVTTIAVLPFFFGGGNTTPTGVATVSYTHLTLPTILLV